ncbi:uncharacterized protein LOC130051195 [Ostrea edulis]|uniref:uncharacterized protein LOC130051195 n=1 Tax=Ostrea edulis TaxID=37623 RepID=UPI0024AFE796|nr:uncharacterized protein LOC130051195 [Ostrea edulis]
MKDQLNEMFGSLSPLSINTKQAYRMESPEVVLSPPVRPLLDEPRITATIDTGHSPLFSVSCLGEEQVWTCGKNKIIKLLNLQDKLLTSIQTESGNDPRDITVSWDGDLLYTDPGNKTVNLVKNKQVQTVIRLQGWKPLYVCTTISDDLLVTMISDGYKQYKVVRYFGSTETHIIQFDDQGQPLYSSDDMKYISENRNLDICVADWAAKAVVVVNQSGKLRFRYTGHPSNIEELFYPCGITTDSQSHILTADCNNDRIHILDQNGQFLRYIDTYYKSSLWGLLRYIDNKCNIRHQWGLCVDIRDNLFVAECDTGQVKQIQYL